MIKRLLLIGVLLVILTTSTLAAQVMYASSKHAFGTTSLEAMAWLAVIADTGDHVAFGQATELGRAIGEIFNIPIGKKCFFIRNLGDGFIVVRPEGFPLPLITLDLYFK